MLVAHYEFESNTDDSSGNSNDASATGSPAFVTGALGQAVYLDGSNDFVTLPAGVADSSDITVATWVYWNGGDGWQRIFDFGNNTTEYMFLTPSTGGSDELKFSITTSSNGGEQRIATSPLSTAQWTHVAVTLQDDVATLYVDSSPVGSNSAVTIDPNDFSPANNYIGDSQWSSDPLFNGRIDDFRIYNYALTAPAIAALASGTPDTDPPSAPTGLIATVGDGEVILNWDDNTESDLMRYDIYRTTTSGSGYEVVHRGTPTSDYVDTTATGGTEFYYVVTAVDINNNESAGSNEALAIRLMHDYEPDGDVDLADYNQFINCLSGPEGTIANCQIFDSDQDGDVDLVDFASFQWVFTGSQ